MHVWGGDLSEKGRLCTIVCMSVGLLAAPAWWEPGDSIPSHSNWVYDHRVAELFTAVKSSATPHTIVHADRLACTLVCIRTEFAMPVPISSRISAFGLDSY